MWIIHCSCMDEARGQDSGCSPRGHAGREKAMQIGIFEKVFRRPTLDATLDAVREHGLTAVQFDLLSAGLPSMPDQIEPEQAQAIQHALAARGITMAAISGTF